jgi:hypothetical protein
MEITQEQADDVLVFGVRVQTFTETLSLRSINFKGP